MLRCSRDEAHGQAVIVFNWLLGQVVGLLDAVDCATLARTHAETRQECNQDGLHHHHGDVLAHAGARPASEGLEEPFGNLSFAHGEVNHRMVPQRLVDENLQYFQTLCSVSGLCLSSISMKKRLMERVSGAAITISSTHCLTSSPESSPWFCSVQSDW